MKAGQDSFEHYLLRATRLETYTLDSIMASKPAYPPGGTWFDTLKKSFTDVAIDPTNDNAIATSDFLEAAESLTTLFGRSRTTASLTSSG